MKVVNSLFPLSLALVFVAALQFPTVATARDVASKQPILAAMQTPTAKTFIGVEFYFGSQAHPSVKRSLGTYTSRRTTNAFNKSDHDSCQWGFLSAVKTLYERAKAEGGNAVINIVSVTTGETFTSDSEFVCRAGSIVTKVYLEGEVVLL